MNKTINVKEAIEAIEDTINSAGYKMLVFRMVQDLKSTRNSLVIYPGEKQNEKDDIFKKGQIDKLVYILNLPTEILNELEKK